MKLICSGITFISLLLTSLGLFGQTLDTSAKTPQKAVLRTVAGGVVSGGGSFVKMKGTIGPADSLFADVPTSDLKEITSVSFSELPKDLQNYVIKIFHFMEPMSLSDTRMKEFFFKFIQNENKKVYNWVPKGRNAPCRIALPKLKQKVSDHFQFGCTFKEDTYLLVDQFKRAPLWAQAFGILHERMWAAFPQAQQKDIAAFVGGLALFEQRFHRQLLEQERVDMPLEEINAVDAFFAASLKFNFLTGSRLADVIKEKKYKVVSGGAIIYGCPELVSISRSFLGMGSRIVSECNKGTLTVANSTVESSLIRVTRDEHLEIKNSIVKGSSLRDVTLSQSQVIDSHVIESTLTESSVAASSIIGPAHLNHTSIKNSRDGNGYFTDRRYVLLAENSSLDNVTFFGDSNIQFADLKNSTFTGNTTLKGTADSRIQILASELGGSKIVVGAGTKIETAKVLNTSTQTANLLIGHNVELRSLQINHPPGNPKKTLDLQIEPNTSLDHGQFNLGLACNAKSDGTSGNQFNLGKEGQGFALDLAGKPVTLKMAWPSCALRF